METDKDKTEKSSHTDSEDGEFDPKSIEKALFRFVESLARENQLGDRD